MTFYFHILLFSPCLNILWFAAIFLITFTQHSLVWELKVLTIQPFFLSILYLFSFIGNKIKTFWMNFFVFFVYCRTLFFMILILILLIGTYAKPMYRNHAWAHSLKTSSIIQKILKGYKNYRLAITFFPTSDDSCARESNTVWCCYNNAQNSK